ncbi:MAG: DNA gyrase inhibitor YacG [Sulfuricella sp.]|nr:DNA gyrase inhibitor YacG [Sulfuricella sp.]
MVACPTCGKPIPYATDNPYRPFCSRRCKLIDLGQWANEEFRIPEAEKPLPDEV